MKKAIVNLIGVMPDGVYPSETSDCKDCDYVFIYYRTDGSLYLYDSKLQAEFDLFNLTPPNI